MKTLLSAIVGATLALATCNANADSAPGQRPVALAIESMSLASALDKWAQQSGFQIFVQDWELTKGLAAPSLKGTFTAQAALEQLLAGTSLTYVWLSEKAVSIRKRAPQTVPAALQRTGLEGQQHSPPIAKFSGDDAGGGAATYPRSESASREGGGEPNSHTERLEEIIVTGTYIRGAAPVGSPLKIYSREDMDRTGAATVEQFARTMIENFSNMDATANYSSSATRYAHLSDASIFGGSAFNLRGIGASSTLTLLNGNRIAAGGFGGEITDTSLIPLSAIDRIEVMADGASAIYGTDAVAGVVNIITRDDFDGAETSVRYGAATDGGAAQRVASQLLGMSWNAGNALLNYEYNKQDDLDVSQREYLPDQGGPYSLLPENGRNSVFVAASQEIGSTTKVDVNALYSDRETTGRLHQHSAFFVSDASSRADVKQSGGSLAIGQELAGDWIAKLSGNYSEVRQSLSDRTTSSLFNALVAREADTEVIGGDLSVTGTLVQMPAGGLKGAFGMGSRQEKFDNLVAASQELFGMTFSTSSGIPGITRRVKSAYAELLMPVVRNADWAEQLDLSAAIRYDDYSDFGSSTNYKLGVAWSPIIGLRLRSTYGTSFRAPLLKDVGANVASSVGFLSDPGSPTGFINVLFLGGGNPELRPEESDSYTVGFDIQPQAIPQLSVAATYFDIDFRNRISSPSVSINPLFDPLAQPFITRDPPLADAQAYFDSPGFEGDPTGQGPSAVRAIFDARRANMAATKQSGVELTTAYDLATRYGRLAFNISAQRLFNNDYQVVSIAPYVELLNRFAQPPKWKGRAGAAWAQAGFNASLSINYTNSYTNGLGATTNTPGSDQSIDSWTTADLYFSYTVPTSVQALGDLTIALSATNITDEDPPFADIPAVLTLPDQRVLPFDAANASPLGRYLSLSIAKRW